VSHASQETNRCFNEAQRQMLSIRQARDAAQALNAELSQKLARSEDAAADLQYHLELLERKLEEGKELSTQVEALRKERDEAIQARQTAAGELEQVQARITELTQAAGEASGAHETALAELREQISTVSNERDALRKERDEVTQARQAVAGELEQIQARVADLTQATADAGRNHEGVVAEIREQISVVSAERDALRQERDEMAQARQAAAGELEQIQARVVELTAQTRAAADAGNVHEAALTEVREQVSAVTVERDVLRKELYGKTNELEKIGATVSELMQEKETLLQAGVAHEMALAEIRAQVTALQKTRDGVQVELEAKSKEVEALRQSSEADKTRAVEALQNDVKSLQHECSTADLRVQVLSREVIDLRNQLQDRAEQIASLQRTVEQNTSAKTVAHNQLDALNHERDAAQRMRDEALTSLSAAQKQIDKIIRDRDLARQQSIETNLALEAQVDALRAQLQVIELAGGISEGGTGHADISEMARLLETREQEKRELADRLEQQRAETIDLAAQFRSSQDQIKQLSANLAEIRLQAKLGGRPAPSVAPPVHEPGAILSVPIVPDSMFTATESQELLRSMRRSYQAFLKDSSDVSHLNELHGHVHSFSERARSSGLVALHRLSAAFSGLAQELYHYPEQVNPSVLRTIGQTIEFLTTLMKVKDLRQVKDPATATIYAVDDDADNCDCIRMAMETAMMQTTSTQDPAKALCELAENSHDLIFLDVNLPGMDGFELCAEIRRLTRHTTTPIIFLSGLTSSENRMQSSLSGGNEFVGKPFILCELTVKALTLILKAELHLA